MNVKKKLKKVAKSAVGFAHRANRARLRFKKQHPKVYKYGKRALIDGVVKSSGYGAEYAVVRGAYRAYKGRNRGIRFQAKNALSTYGDYVHNLYR